MANLRLIKRRIKSAKNISQVTKALEMVSAVKMRKAQETAMAGKPYANELKRVLLELGGKVEKDLHPFLNPVTEVNKVMVVVIGSEKGLAGALVTNLARKVFSIQQQIENGKLILDDQNEGEAISVSRNAKVTAVSWGKKAREILKKTGWQIVADFSTKTGEPLEDMIRALDNLTSTSYLTRGSDLVIVVYANFVNTMTQKPAAIQFLPMTAQQIAGAESNHVSSAIVNFEPSPAAVLDSLLTHYLKTILTQIIFDSLAAEHSARMVAMKNANENASDIIKGLTASYNETRQAAITNEIADIVSGSMIAV
jgi:F-type H+-transporting ATPase subunit gamma